MTGQPPSGCVEKRGPNSFQQLAAMPSDGLAHIYGEERKVSGSTNTTRPVPTTSSAPNFPLLSPPGNTGGRRLSLPGTQPTNRLASSSETTISSTKFAAGSVHIATARVGMCSHPNAAHRNCMALPPLPPNAEDMLLERARERKDHLRSVYKSKHMQGNVQLPAAYFNFDTRKPFEGIYEEIPCDTDRSTAHQTYRTTNAYPTHLSTMNRTVSIPSRLVQCSTNSEMTAHVDQSNATSKSKFIHTEDATHFNTCSLAHETSDGNAVFESSSRTKRVTTEQLRADGGSGNTNLQFLTGFSSIPSNSDFADPHVDLKSAHNPIQNIKPPSSYTRTEESKVPFCDTLPTSRRENGARQVNLHHLDFQFARECGGFLMVPFRKNYNVQKMTTNSHHVIPHCHASVTTDKPLPSEGNDVWTRSVADGHAFGYTAGHPVPTGCGAPIIAVVEKEVCASNHHPFDNGMQDLESKKSHTSNQPVSEENAHNLIINESLSVNSQHSNGRYDHCKRCQRPHGIYKGYFLCHSDTGDVKNELQCLDIAGLEYSDHESFSLLHKIIQLNADQETNEVFPCKSELVGLHRQNDEQDGTKRQSFSTESDYGSSNCTTSQSDAHSNESKSVYVMGSDRSSDTFNEYDINADSRSIKDNIEDTRTGKFPDHSLQSWLHFESEVCPKDRFANEPYASVREDDVISFTSVTSLSEQSIIPGEEILSDDLEFQKSSIQSHVNDEEFVFSDYSLACHVRQFTRHRKAIRKKRKQTPTETSSPEYYKLPTFPSIVVSSSTKATEGAVPFTKDTEHRHDETSNQIQTAGQGMKLCISASSNATVDVSLAVVPGKSEVSELVPNQSLKVFSNVDTAGTVPSIGDSEMVVSRVSSLPHGVVASTRHLNWTKSRSDLPVQPKDQVSCLGRTHMPTNRLLSDLLRMNHDRQHFM